jgi:hypothetical protein
VLVYRSRRTGAAAGPPVLRDAGLITTIRVGTSVLHSLHPKGDLVLNQ